MSLSRVPVLECTVDLAYATIACYWSTVLLEYGVLNCNAPALGVHATLAKSGVDSQSVFDTRCDVPVLPTHELQSISLVVCLLILGRMRRPMLICLSNQRMDACMPVRSQSRHSIPMHGAWTYSHKCIDAPHDVRRSCTQHPARIRLPDSRPLPSITQRYDHHNRGTPPLVLAQKRMGRRHD